MASCCCCCCCCGGGGGGGDAAVCSGAEKGCLLNWLWMCGARAESRVSLMEMHKAASHRCSYSVALVLPDAPKRRACCKVRLGLSQERCRNRWGLGGLSLHHSTGWRSQFENRLCCATQRPEDQWPPLSKFEFGQARPVGAVPRHRSYPRSQTSQRARSRAEYTDESTLVTGHGARTRPAGFLSTFLPWAVAPGAPGMDLGLEASSEQRTRPSSEQAAGELG